jgi:hypothetical protein
MEIKDKINIASDFGKTPGARYRYEGAFSGEAFLEDILRPKFIQAVEGNYKILILLDGVLGYPSSFISGSFGKLSVDNGSSKVLKHLEFESKNNLRIEKILLEIKTPNRK